MSGPCRLCYFYDPYPQAGPPSLCCLHLRTVDKEATCSHFKYKRKMEDARRAVDRRKA